MLNRIKQLYQNVRSKYYSVRRIEKAYFDRDSQFLRKAYRYGYSYHKRLAVQYLGKIPVQANLDLLLKEMKAVAEIQLRAYILQSALTLTQDKRLLISAQDRLFLNQHLTLLNLVRPMPTGPSQTTSTPISFSHRRRDLLGDLEDMKRQFEAMAF